MNSWYNSLQGVGVFLRGFLVSTIIFILSWCALIVFIDPIHYFRLNNKISLYPHTRWQNAGIIKHIPFDSIVIGTSMTQNFDLKQISSLLNCHCVSLALPGCDVQEQLVVLKKAIESKKLKTIIWAIDRWCLGYKKDSFRASFPVELYQNQYKGVARYLFSFEMFKSAAYKLFKYYILGKAPLNIDEELQKENMWFRYERLNFSKSAVMKEYKQKMGNNAYIYIYIYI